MWKSLKDFVRYRKKKKANGAGSNEEDDDWEFKECLSFIIENDMSRKYGQLMFYSNSIDYITYACWFSPEKKNPQKHSTFLMWKIRKRKKTRNILKKRRLYQPNVSMETMQMCVKWVHRRLNN